uniref:DUF3800 domain-containing protein n=1 Tax=Cyanothece sp. (strain PCC 7425 / ATCC 29141) TaxID=395961 RepID=B8HWN3_CYAP4
MQKYRLYIDEVGNADLGNSVSQDNNRYLSLTGVIFDVTHARDILFPQLEDLKAAHFKNHSPQKPVILHRKELVKKKYPFEDLRDPAVELSFNQTLLKLFVEWEYKVITVVIDKLNHKQKYKTWMYYPYHYCLAVTLERYVKWLDAIDCVGDVYSESRGKRDNKMLERSFQLLYRNGNR